MTREWDAASYDDLPLPHVAWGRGVVERLRAQPGERVLDAGCGTGRDAALLLDQQPDVHVVALDGSAQMLAAARDRLGDRAVYLHADLAEPLPLDEPVDAVMSVACFHWLPDHALLFRHLAAVLRPGGRLVSDCGGRGNIAGVQAAVAQVLGRPAHAPRSEDFADAAATRARLQDAGFAVQDVRLRPDPCRIPDPALLERYLATVVLGGYLAEQDDPDRFVREVRLALREPVLDYVRLEVEAVRA